MPNNEMMVSVQMLSYNHEDSLARAIESVLGQRTKYKYELIIGDDASTDRSQERINEYAHKYPEIIVAVCREKNIGAVQNGNDISKRCRGKYHAVCEGDDYWITTDKLEKQVSFLESNPEYMMCTTRCKVISDGIEMEYPFASDDSDSLLDMLNGGNVKRYATCTTIIRALGKEKPELYKFYSDNSVGDLVTQTIAAKYGKIHYIDEETAVYNKKTVGKESFSSQILEIQVNSIRNAIRSCKELSGKEYDRLWDRYIASFDKALFYSKSEEGMVESFKWLLALKDGKEIIATIREILIDYLETKKMVVKKRT